MSPPRKPTSAMRSAEDIELDLFILAMRERHGHDFAGYARSSLLRRLRQLMPALQAESLSALTGRMLRDDGLLETIVAGISVPVSSMFRDPVFFACLRNEVLPVLASYPRLTLWVAGCARGEEVYSLAILLAEAGLQGRSVIHATDISQPALEAARRGRLDARQLAEFEQNYRETGGRRTLTDYFEPDGTQLVLKAALRSSLNYASHNLATDGVFCEAQLILCRNVLIYFDTPLQERVIGLFRQSLVPRGYLGLGHRESLELTTAGRAFSTIDRDARLYQLTEPPMEHAP